MVAGTWIAFDDEEERGNGAFSPAAATMDVGDNLAILHSDQIFRVVWTCFLLTRITSHLRQ